MNGQHSFLKSGAIISLDNENVIIGHGGRTWHSTPPLNNRASFYFPDFFLHDAAPWMQHQDVARVPLRDLLVQVPPGESGKVHTWKVVGERNFAEQFDELNIAFKRGLLEKAVPYLFYCSDNLISPAASLRHLITYCLEHRAYIYGFWDEAQGILGATPERLFNLKPDGSLCSAAIAGTVSSDREKELLADEKLTKEHDIVVQGIQDALSPFGLVSIGKTQLLSLPHLSHLYTPIEAKINCFVKIEALIKAMHPTPALGAFPKENGNQWLKDMDQLLPRGRYGAPVGIKNGDFFTSYAAIRNVQWNLQGSKIGVGCGVVNTSDFKKERDELALKFKAICSILNL